MTFNFIWSVIERAYKEKGQLVGATDAERAAVVAWLRRGDACCAANATRIERGEHRREEKP